MSSSRDRVRLHRDRRRRGFTMVEIRVNDLDIAALASRGYRIQADITLTQLIEAYLCDSLAQQAAPENRG